MSNNQAQRAKQATLDSYLLEVVATPDNHDGEEGNGLGERGTVSAMPLRSYFDALG